MSEIHVSDTCSIYRLHNTVNGKSYVGQTWYSIRRRWNQHRQEAPNRSHCIKLVNAIRKYGVFVFEPELLTVAHSQEIADYWEAYFMQRFDSVKNGYNLRAAGAAGRLSEETKARMRAAHKGKVISPEQRAKLRAANLGKKQPPRSAEWCEKIGAAHRGRKHSPEHIAKLAASHLGHKRSPESCLKQSRTMRGRPIHPNSYAVLFGRPCSEETKAKQRAAWVERKKIPRKPVSEETRNRLRNAAAKRKLQPHTVAELAAYAARKKRTGS